MLTDRLGRWLFPRWQPYRRRREIKALLVALTVGFIVAGLVTVMIILTNSMGR